jgi:hypothetical protein
LNLAGFHFVVAPIQLVPHLGEFREVTGHGVLNNFFRRAPYGGG